MYFISSLLLLSTVYMHACTARHLPFMEKDLPQHGKVNGLFNFRLNQGKVNSEKSSIVQTSNYNPDHDDPKIPKASKYSKDLSLKEKTENYAGSAIDESLSPKMFDESTPHVVMLNATQVEVEVSKSRHGNKEAINDSMKERVAEMDYEPPQKKTPIHNK